MGILQKDRRGTRGAKPPIPVPGCWLARICNDRRDSDDDASSKEEALLMQRLRSQADELAACSDATWMEQSKWLKATEVQLAGLKRLAEISPATLSFLRAVAIPMFVECYFLPADVVARRQAIPVIKALSQLDPSCVDSVLQANLLAYIGAQDRYAELEVQDIVDGWCADEAYARQTAGQRALALEVLANVPLGLAVMRRFTSDILAYAAASLDRALPDLSSPSGDAGSVEVAALRDACTQHMRLACLCVSKLVSDDAQDACGSLQLAILASMRSPSPGFVEQTLARMYALCWQLVGCEHASLSGRQVAAMVLVALIEGAGTSREGRAVALAVRALAIEVRNADELADSESTYLPGAVDSPDRQQCLGDAVSMICIARAIVALASYETTLVALDIVPSARISSVCSTVHEAVFTHIASICGRSQLAPGVKIIVFEAMAIWLQETAKLLNRCLESLGSSDTADEAARALSCTAFALGQRVLVLQRERIMGYLWAYWDDPIDAVQAKVRTIFEAFLDIGSAMNRAVVLDPTIAQSTISMAGSGDGGNSDHAPDPRGDSNAFLGDVLHLVLAMDWSRRVKYSLLAALSARLSVLELLRRHPEIIDQCLETMAQVTMASRAASLLTSLLGHTSELLRQPGGGAARPANQPDAGIAAGRAKLEAECMRMWVAPVVAALCRDDDTSRRMLAQLLLPELCECMPRIVGEILRELVAYQRPVDDHGDLGRVEAAWQQQALDSCRQHALIIVLKVARSQDIVTIDQLVAMDAEQKEQAEHGQVSMSIMDMLNRAVYHPDWSVRADMAGLLCESRKQTTPLNPIEYDLLFRLLRVSANAPSADFRQQQYGALTTLALRLATVATHAERVVATGRPPVPSQKVRHRERARKEAALAKGRAEGRADEEVLRELGILPQDELVARSKEALAQVRWAVGQWIDLAVRGCLYPGAGFAKVAMGLQWLDILTRHFAPGCSAGAEAEDSTVPPFVVACLAAPDFRRAMEGSGCSVQQAGEAPGGVTAEEVVTVLTQVLIDDPFDANRSRAFSLLTAWPLVPLGDQDAAQAAQRWATRLLQRALHLANSTRAGESESGALIIRWLFRKFVVLLGIRLDIVHPETPACDAVKVGGSESNMLEFVTGLLARIKQCQAAAERNLLDAAQSYPLHGLLTAAQYVVREIDSDSPAVQVHSDQWRIWLQDLAQAAMAVCDVVLGVLTSALPEGNIPASFREMEDKIDDIIRSAATIDIAGDAASEDDVCDVDDDLLGGEVGLGGPAGPRQQVILSYCWRAVKEVSGLLAAVATRLPGTDQLGAEQRASDQSGAEQQSSIHPLVEEATVGSIGTLLHTLLTSIRHRGAFSAVYPAFRDLCGRMYRSPAAPLNQQVGRWLDQCLDAAAICKISVTRRSAGWPLCLLSIVTCDKLATQALLPRALDRIFALANNLQTEGSEVDDGGADGTTDLPQVHALNMLRELVDDHTLASDIVPYIEQAYVLALTGLRSRRWAIRNTCSLLYAALTRRVFGNSRARDETKYDGITGRELFTRFPGLHPFLTKQLEDAVDRLTVADMVREGNQQGAADAIAAVCESAEAGVLGRAMPPGDPVDTVLRSGAKFIHPALYPCLILLARLQPSLIDASKQSAAPPSADEGSVAAAEAVGLGGDFDMEKGSLAPRRRRPSQAAETAGLVATTSHAASSTEAVAPPMNLEQEPLTRVNERNSTVHVTSASTMLSMYSFTGLVEMCVDNPVFKTREMAARAFAPLIPSDQAAAACVSLIRGIRDAGDTIASNSCHGVLCQVHELLRVHWHLGDNGSESMRWAFIRHIFPALSSLWPILVQSLDRRTSEDGSLAASNEPAATVHEVTDVVRHKYLTIINDFVARGETWLLRGVGDAALVRTVRVLLSRFRLTMLYGSLHPLFASSQALEHLGSAQVPGAYGTVLELTRLYLACVDDRTTAVVRGDGSVQLQVDGELMDEHGVPFDSDESSNSGGGGSEVMYAPWPALSSVLMSNAYYEAKLCVLEWMADHAEHERMEIVERIGIDNLLPLLIIDVRGPGAAAAEQPGMGAEGRQQPSRDPLVRAAAIRLLTLLCTKLDVDVNTLPVGDALAFWDSISDQLQWPRCPLSVSTALVEFQAALVHMVHAHASSGGSVEAMAAVGRRTLAWAQRLYGWADAENAEPYRRAVSRALVTYSVIKRYKEAGGTEAVSMDGPSEEVIRLCYWRLLQDDDEDIREYVAASISRRLGRELACDQACEKLVADFAPAANGRFPMAYIDDRLAYLLGLPDGQTASDVVRSAISPGRALFEHECPNVYIDEPRNVQLAYFSLVTIADTFAPGAELGVLVDGAVRCVEALRAAIEVLHESRDAAMRSGVALAGALGVTSLATLFPRLQSWILGARLALFAASRLDDSARCAAVADGVRGVADAWLTSEELKPVHPWIVRTLRSLLGLAVYAGEEGASRRITREQAVADLFLLTFAS